jgi:hypothetical protein
VSDDIRSVLRLLMAFFLGSSAGAASASTPSERPDASQTPQAGGAAGDSIEVAQATVQNLEEFLTLYATGSPGGAASPPRQRRAQPQPPTQRQPPPTTRRTTVPVQVPYN